MAKAKKLRYPEEVPFRFMGFDWKIKFLDIETDNFGVTISDTKVVHIYYKNKGNQDVLDTVIHELMHVIMFDMNNAVFKHEVNSVEEMEENLVRLSSPRLFAMIRDNPELVEFIMEKMGELDV